VNLDNTLFPSKKHLSPFSYKYLVILDSYHRFSSLHCRKSGQEPVKTQGLSALDDGKSCQKK
jgi:hypothetical protein